MANFKIQDQDDKIPMVETHYFKWLKTVKPISIHKSTTKVNYLKSHGFIIGTNFITEKEISTLNAIEDCYFTIVIKPKLDKIIAKFTK